MSRKVIAKKAHDAGARLRTFDAAHDRHVSARPPSTLRPHAAKRRKPRWNFQPGFRARCPSIKLTDADIAFYSTAAQIIAVLFLALVFQARSSLFDALVAAQAEKGARAIREHKMLKPWLDTFGDHPELGPKLREVFEESGQEMADKERARWGGILAYCRWIVLLYLVLGETLALRALSEGRAASGDRTAVVVGLVLGGSVLVATTVYALADEFTERSTRAHTLAVLLPTLITCGLVVYFVLV